MQEIILGESFLRFLYRRKILGLITITTPHLIDSVLLELWDKHLIPPAAAKGESRPQTRFNRMPMSKKKNVKEAFSFMTAQPVSHFSSCNKRKFSFSFGWRKKAILLLNPGFFFWLFWTFAPKIRRTLYNLSLFSLIWEQLKTISLS